MKKGIVFFIVVLVFCLLAFVAVMAFVQNSPSVRWEYMMLDTLRLKDNDIIQRSNELGQQGWELVLSGVNGNYRMIFKRVIR